MSRPHPQEKPTLTAPSFLDEVLEAVLAHPLCEARQLHRLAVVVPSHRVMSRLRSALQKKLPSPVEWRKQRVSSWVFCREGFENVLHGSYASREEEFVCRLYKSKPQGL